MKSAAWSLGVAAATWLAYAPGAWAGGNLFDRQVGALTPVACAAQGGCWTNYLRLADIDGDEDLDIIFVNYDGFFAAGTAEPLVLYENDGAGGFTDVSAQFDGGHTARLRQVAIGDVDGDGVNDVFAPDAQGGAHALFINDGAGSFTNEFDARVSGGITAQAGATRMADFDGDGSMDIFVAAGFTQGPSFDPAGFILFNDGSGNFEGPGEPLPASIAGTDIDDVDVLDVDRDFDLDILVNAHVGNNGLFINDGSGTFTDGSGGLPVLSGGFHYGPGICDVDGDGDLDVWIDNAGTGGNRFEILMVNDGNGMFTDVTAAQHPDNSTDDDNGVTCADVDNDGDFDAVVTGLTSVERMFSNAGDGNFSETPNVFPGPQDTSLWLEFGDLNGDGRVDLVTGQGEGDTANQVYLGNAALPVDDRAPVVIAQETVDVVGAGETPVLRFAVSDRIVTDEGPRVRGFARVTINAAASRELPADFVGGDLFSASLLGQAEGVMVEVELCAVDRAGNEGCGDVFSYEVDAGDSTGGMTSTGDAETGDETAGAEETDGPSSGVSASETASASETSPSGSGSGSDTDTDTGGGDVDLGSCGCRSANGFGSALLLLIAVCGLRRRRFGIDRTRGV